jgi:hypothetical protein
MADLFQVITDWDVDGSAPGQTVMYFDTTNVTIGDTRTALAAFWENIDGVLSNRASWTLRASGKVLDSATGGLVAEWAQGSAISSEGDAGADPVPNAAQMLFRWSTGVVVGGRVLKGRTFVPGFRIDQLDSGGQIVAAARTAVQPAIDTLIDDTDMHIWHRPQGGSGGTSREVLAGSVWSEFAVLRHRRG